MMLYLDTETTSLAGMTVIIQWCIDDGPIEIFCPWQHSAKETLQLIEMIMSHEEGYCGFNLTFDHFHLTKLYNTFRLLDPDAIPVDIIDTVAIAEERGRDAVCVKPVKALDLMLHSRKGPYQSLMDRHNIIIKKVPRALAQLVADKLEEQVHLNPIYFARKKKNYERQWQVEDIEDVADFQNIIMRFAPSTALKVLAGEVLKVPKQEILLYSDVEINKEYYSKELGYAPFAMALGKPGNWNGMWPDVIHFHIQHWTTNELARKYARLDVDYLRRLRTAFGNPPAGDDDSELACSVGACRWRGFNVDLKGIAQAKQEAEIIVGKTPTSTGDVRRYLEAVMSKTELVTSEMNEKGSTKRQILERIRDNWLTEGKMRHPAAERAKLVIEARTAVKEIELYDKLLIAGRLHPDFNIIGALSSRMSGAGGLNLQGIDKRKKVRKQFLFAFPPDKLCGGDFSAFEVVLAIAAWKDKKLEELVKSYRTCHKCNGEGKAYNCLDCKGKGKLETDEDGHTLLCDTCNGTGESKKLNECVSCKGKGKVKTKIHAVFGTFMYRDKTYEEILNSDGQDPDYYTRAKSGLFSQFYGGTEYTLSTRLVIDEESASIGRQYFLREFPGMAEAERKVTDMFCAMKQPGGIGTKVEWHEPADFVAEPILGHRRYFTLENKICKTLFDLANNPPKEWLALRIPVKRRDREQTVAGAVQSALYACAFSIQQGNLRAARNHEIQASGAKICKHLQRRIWDLQPSGIHPFVVQPINVHDECLSVTKPDAIAKVREVVNETVESFQDRVPLLAIDWQDNMPSWAGKKG